MANLDLEQRVNDQTAELRVSIAEAERASSEAERANLAKSKFLAAASHDLRQPVQSLTLLLSVIGRQVAEMPKAASMVEMAKASMASLNAILTGMLDISRLDAGVITPAFASVDLGELVNRLALEYAPRAAVDGLVLRHAPRALRARADAVLLQQILRNLIENALRYTAKGGVLIGMRQRGDHVRLDVIDTGMGIAADHQTEIFEEFRQLNNPARDSSKGLGLGLAIVSRLAHLLDIQIELASSLGRGTRFSLLLPVAQTEAPVAAVNCRWTISLGAFSSSRTPPICARPMNSSFPTGAMRRSARPTGRKPLNSQPMKNGGLTPSLPIIGLALALAELRRQRKLPSKPIELSRLWY
jgi:signal transduction histidine kinase